MVKSPKLAIFCDFNPVNLKIAKNDIAYPVANFARNLKILIFFLKKIDPTIGEPMVFIKIHLPQKLNSSWKYIKKCRSDTKCSWNTAVKPVTRKPFPGSFLLGYKETSLKKSPQSDEFKRYYNLSEVSQQICQPKWGQIIKIHQFTYKTLSNRK